MYLPETRSTHGHPLGASARAVSAALPRHAMRGASGVRQDHMIWLHQLLVHLSDSRLTSLNKSVGRFSCNTCEGTRHWEGIRVTCDMALQAGNQFHLFSNFEKYV